MWFQNQSAVGEFGRIQDAECRTMKTDLVNAGGQDIGQFLLDFYRASEGTAVDGECGLPLLARCSARCRS